MYVYVQSPVNKPHYQRCECRRSLWTKRQHHRPSSPNRRIARNINVKCLHTVSFRLWEYVESYMTHRIGCRLCKTPAKQVKKYWRWNFSLLVRGKSIFLRDKKIATIFRNSLISKKKNNHSLPLFHGFGTLISSSYIKINFQNVLLSSASPFFRGSSKYFGSNICYSNTYHPSDWWNQYQKAL